MTWASSEDQRDAWRQQLARAIEGEIDFLVADSGGRVLGKAVIDWAHDDACTPWLWMFSVDPDFRSRGIGSQLLACAEQRAHERGHDVVEMAVDDDNPRARALYLRNGYIPVGPYLDVYDVIDPDGSITQVSRPGERLRKRLAAQRGGTPREPSENYAELVDTREVTPHDAVAFAAWHAAFESGSRAGRVAATVPTFQELTDSLSLPSPVKRRIAVGAFAGGMCLGAMLFELPLQSDGDTALVQIAVPPAHRRQGVATGLWAWAVARATSEGRTTFQTEVFVPTGQTVESWPGAVFATVLGFVSENVEDHLVVALPLDPTRLDALGAPSAGYDIATWVGACPDEHVDAWADLHTAMSADVPTGGLAREPVTYTVERLRTDEKRMVANWISLHSMALTRAGKPVGYSTIFVPLGAPEHVFQDDTLVLNAHRGHNLGAQLKVANLRQLSQQPPVILSERRWLHTYTAQDNTAMQRVNARFGFRTVEVLHELERRSPASDSSDRTRPHPGRAATHQDSPLP